MSKNSLTQKQRRAKLADMRATENQRKQLARRKALGVALIQGPLKYIKKRGAPWEYGMARGYADSGNGQAVRRLARSVK